MDTLKSQHDRATLAMLLYHRVQYVPLHVLDE
jgi:hypothetical protein